MPKRNGSDIGEKINAISCRIEKERNMWKQMNESGCNDPSWTDGVNMNLARNHIIGYRKSIELLCEEAGKPFPDEYYMPVPPKVSDMYMANMNQKERVKRLATYERKLTTKRIEYDETQLSFI